MPMEIDQYCDSLFSYIYQNYRDSPSCELAAGLPVRCNFRIPREFDRVVGDMQIHINKILRKYLIRLFNRAISYAARTEHTFLEFVGRRCSRISFDSVEVSILTLGAFVSELNLYLFQRDCYRYAVYAPKCLSELLKESPTIVNYLMTESPGPSDEVSNGYEKLKEYCETMLYLKETTPDYIPEIYRQIGHRFKKMKDKMVDIRLPLTMAAKMTSVPEVEEEEDEEDETAPLVEEELPPPSPEQCRFCREANCVSYMQQYEELHGEK